MSQTSSIQCRSAVRGSRYGVPVGLWQEFVRQVAAFRPDVVILVARKMPRLQEAFGLDFGASHVCSDLAIPFLAEYLKGADVAIVDDVVNVGTTMRHAFDRVRACGAAEIRLFALGARPSHTLGDLPLEVTVPEPMTETRYRELVASVPETIQLLAKPYDIEFPIFRCMLAPWANCAADVVDWARDHFREAVHDLLWPSSFSHIRRITIDLPQQRGTRKIRLYIDDERRTCALVPIAIPDSLSQLHVSHSVAHELAGSLYRLSQLSPPSAELWAGEAMARARLFCASLDLGLTVVNDFASAMVPIDPGFLSIPDAAQLFGPGVYDILSASPSDAGVGELATEFLPSEGTLTPFADHLTEFGDGQFLERVVELSTARYGNVPHARFAAMFDVLALMVHATIPGTPNLDWPYTTAEIASAPYLRLRIGPAFQDLVVLMQRLMPELKDVSSAVQYVSRQLDLCIDSGAVVPTIARYDGVFYRIYRKGESDYRDTARQRIQVACDRLHKSGRTMSLTRMAKINAILAYSRVMPELLWPSSLERGTVATMQETVLDQSGPEAGQYLRDCGALPPFGGTE